MIFGKHINRYYLRYGLWLLLGLASLVLVDVLQLQIPKFYRMIIDGMTYGIDTGPTGLLLRHVTDGGDHYILRANNPDVPESTIPKTAVLRIFQFCGFLGYTSL
jgi:hypothetical protein